MQSGAPLWVADAAGFVLALAVVTFLHLVIGEMAPKSWAIAHPERAATLLAIPMRAFMTVTRPLLIALNHAANWCLRRVGVTPVDDLDRGQDPDALRYLLEHSATVGTLDQRNYRNLTSALELERLTVGDIVSRTLELSSVAAAPGRCGHSGPIAVDSPPTDTRARCRPLDRRGGARSRQPARPARDRRPVTSCGRC